MKKLLAFLLVITLSFTIVACAEKGDSSSDNYKTIETSSDTTTEAPRTMAQLIGKTLKEVKLVFGNDTKLGYYHGASTAEYENEKAVFVFTEFSDALDDNCIIAMAVSQGNAKLFDNLTGTMTYPELVEAVSKEYIPKEPTKELDEMFGDYRYFLKFYYQGYHFKYIWNEDPNTNKSVEGQVALSSKQL